MSLFNLAKYSFLIVDDVRTTRIAMLKMLKHAGNPMTYHAENGHEAISMLGEDCNDVNCVIADFNMPVMHGLQMTKIIRGGIKGIRRDVPIIMVTGHGDRNLLGIALALDVNAFLLKPVKSNDLLSRIQRVVDSSGQDISWLKPEESYRCIDVDSSIQSILDKPTVDFKTENPKESPNMDWLPEDAEDDQQEKKDDRVAKVIAQHQGKLRARNQARTVIPSSQTRYAPDERPHSEEEKRIRTIAMSLDKVPANAIVGRDVHGLNGQKLVGSGTKLTPNLIGRLKDLREIGEPVAIIHVRVKSQS